MSTGNVSAGIIGVVALTSPLWLFCVAWCVISRSQIKEKMKKGLSFKESVKQVFKESLVNGSGAASYQHNSSAFEDRAHSSLTDDMHYSPVYRDLGCNIHHR
jgi:hypothetical protein